MLVVIRLAQPPRLMIRILPIHTRRLELRRFRRDDLREFQAYRCDPELAKYQGWEPTNDEDALGFLTQQSEQVLGPEGHWLQVAVCCLDTNLLIGDLGLCVANSLLGVAEIGFTIARGHQQRGYATEAVGGVLNGLFDTNVIAKVAAVTDTRNSASVSLLRRLGFKLAHTDEAIFRGLPCCEYTFEMTSAMWSESPPG